MSLQISSTSTEYVKVEVTKDDGTSPTSDVIYFAFLADGVVPGNDPDVPNNPWHRGNWQTINGKYFARCLVGVPESATEGGTIPDTQETYFTLAPGLYVAWLMITDSPEVPVKRVDYLEVL